MRFYKQLCLRSHIIVQFYKHIVHNAYKKRVMRLYKQVASKRATNAEVFIIKHHNSRQSALLFSGEKAPTPTGAVAFPIHSPAEQMDLGYFIETRQIFLSNRDS